MKRFLWMCSVSLLAACGSTVSLDPVKVEDKTGTTVSRTDANNDATAQATAVDKTGVTSLELGKASASSAIQGARIVYFDYDSFVIKPEFQALVETHARVLKADKGRKVAIEGHTDERGGREYNLALGQKRAEALRNALSLLGVAEAQMEAVSFGEEKAAVPGLDEAAMAKNRRAEIAYRP